MSGFWAKFSCGASPLPSFLILWLLTFSTRQSATAATPTNTCWPAMPAMTASSICCALFTSMRRTRDRVAHLARRQIGDAAHRVDRLVGRAGRDQHALARQQLGLERGHQLI